MHRLQKRIATLTNYGLIIKKQTHRANGKKLEKPILSFSVVDLNNGRFPANYICRLPKNFPDTYYTSQYHECFREPKGALLARELLETAKHEYGDLDIQEEIRTRLSLIEKYLQMHYRRMTETQLEFL